MRPLFYYILLVICFAFIGAFFVSQYSRHVQIGYDLTRLRHERESLRDAGHKLDYHITQAAGLESLVATANRMRLPLRPSLPIPTRTPR